MTEWLPQLAMSAFAGICAYVGAFAAVRTDIAWIKKMLADHAQEIRTLHGRINRLVRSYKND